MTKSEWNRVAQDYSDYNENLLQNGLKVREKGKPV